jgi:predicted PurR-regulated permease PerM
MKYESNLNDAKSIQCAHKENGMNNPSTRLVIYLVGGASIFLILFGIRGSASIINPILLAVVITITVLPLPSRLTKRGMPGWLALVISILMVILLLGLVIGTVFFSVTRLSSELPTYLSSASQQASADLSSTQNPETSAQVEQASLTLGSLARSLVQNVLNLLVQFGFALVIFFFMISAALSLPTPSRLGLDPNSPTLARIMELTEDIRKYMTVLTGINFLVGIGDTLFLLFLGVDYALLWGLLAWFMGYIHSIGFIIALIPPVLLAYAQYGLQTALVVLVGYILINGGVQNFIQPKLMGQRLKISPVVVFVGLFVWGYLLGGIGAILAVPMTMLVLLIMENFEVTRPWAILMRYTGDEKKGERNEAAKHVKGLWGKVKGSLDSDRESKDAIDES